MYDKIMQTNNPNQTDINPEEDVVSHDVMGDVTEMIWHRHKDDSIQCVIRTMRELARIMENQLDARMIIDIPAYFANGKRKTKFIIKISPCYVCFLFFVVYHQDAVTDGYVSIIIRVSVIINARKSHNVRILASFIVLLCCLANCMLRKQETIHKDLIFRNEG